MCLVVGEAPGSARVGIPSSGAASSVIAGREQHGDAFGVQASRDEAQARPTTRRRGSARRRRRRATAASRRPPPGATTSPIRRGTGSAAHRRPRPKADSSAERCALGRPRTPSRNGTKSRCTPAKARSRSDSKPSMRTTSKSSAARTATSRAATSCRCPLRREAPVRGSCPDERRSADCPTPLVRPGDRPSPRGRTLTVADGQSPETARVKSTRARTRTQSSRRSAAVDAESRRSPGSTSTTARRYVSSTQGDDSIDGRDSPPPLHSPLAVPNVETQAVGYPLTTRVSRCDASWIAGAPWRSGTRR